MQFHVLVRERGLDTVIPEIETCLRPVSQMILRTGASVVVFGIAALQDSEQRPNMTTLYLDALEDSTLIRIEIEEERTELDSIEEQNHFVRSKLEDVFSCLHPRLGCDPIQEVIEVDHEKEEEPEKTAGIAETVPELAAVPEVIAVPELVWCLKRW
jgi:hypothetical protein